jgi:hypothetical protein
MGKRVSNARVLGSSRIISGLAVFKETCAKYCDHCHILCCLVHCPLHLFDNSDPFGEARRTSTALGSQCPIHQNRPGAGAQPAPDEAPLPAPTTARCLHPCTLWFQCQFLSTRSFVTHGLMRKLARERLRVHAGIRRHKKKCFSGLCT